MFGQLLFMFSFMFFLAPQAMAGQVDVSTYCLTDVPSDWSSIDGRWIITNKTDSPILLSLPGSRKSITVVSSGPATSVEKPMKAHVRTDRISDGEFVRDWMSVLPAGASCYGVFDPSNYISASHDGSRVTIVATRLHRATTMPVVEEAVRIVDTSDLMLDQGYVRDAVQAHPGYGRVQVGRDQRPTLPQSAVIYRTT